MEIRFTKKAKKEFLKLDKEIQREIQKSVYKKLLLSPKKYLIPLKGDLKGLCKFRIGNYRLICMKEKEKYLILILKVGHRKNIYLKY